MAGMTEFTLNLDEVVEELWRTFGQRAPRERVHQVVAEVAEGFRDVSITSFLPILVRRLTQERLAKEIPESNRLAVRLLARERSRKQRERANPAAEA